MPCTPLLRIFFIFYVISFSCLAFGGAVSVEDIVSRQAGDVKAFFDKLDLSRSGLEDVAAAVEKKDYLTAASAIVKYFDEKKPVSGFDLTIYSVPAESAERALNDLFTWAGEDVRLERNEAGDILWNSLAGTGDSQFPTWLGRHTYMMEILEAYKKTSKPEYIERLNNDLSDWFKNNHFPAAEIAGFEKGTWAKPSNLQWVSLNTAIRVCSWLRLWQNWKQMPIDDGVKLQMIMSLPQYCDYLRWYHRHDGNFKISEMTAISEAAIAFPEFNNAADWLEYGIGELSREIDGQFYPDGSQKELAYHYNRIVVGKLNNLAKIAATNGKQMPAGYLERLENLYRYMAYVIKPNGYGLLNNDSDSEYVLGVISDAAKRYGSDDLLYISSRGAEGKWPRDSFCVVMPWAGQAVFRSSFKEDADWACFEIGPWGIGHQHNDKLHLSVMVRGREILVDAGRYTYIGYHDTSNPWRNYFTGSPSHNVILIDGAGQSAREKEWTKPLNEDDYAITDEFAFARGVYNRGFRGVKDKDAAKFAGKAAHIRNVVYIPQAGWIVTDTIDTDRPRQVDVLWHFHPDCTVELSGNIAFTNDTAKGNLAIKPVVGHNLDLSTVRGIEEPLVQGWYSEKAGYKTANTVAIYSGKIEQTTTFVWMLRPCGQYTGDDGSYECAVNTAEKIVKFRYSGDKELINVVIPLTQGRPNVNYETLMNE